MSIKNTDQAAPPVTGPDGSISRGTLGRPTEPSCISSGRSRMTPAESRAEVARPTVATDRPVVDAISGLDTGPRNRIARMTRAELTSDMRSSGANSSGLMTTR